MVHLSNHAKWMFKWESFAKCKARTIYNLLHNYITQQCCLVSKILVYVQIISPNSNQHLSQKEDTWKILAWLFRINNLAFALVCLPHSLRTDLSFLSFFFFSLSSYFLFFLTSRMTKNSFGDLLYFHCFAKKEEIRRDGKEKNDRPKAALVILNEIQPPSNLVYHCSIICSVSLVFLSYSHQGPHQMYSGKAITT